MTPLPGIMIAALMVVEPVEAADLRSILDNSSGEGLTNDYFCGFSPFKKF